jgi:hypothetical protein
VTLGNLVAEGVAGRWYLPFFGADLVTASKAPTTWRQAEI